jgi:spermidine synthase
MASRKNKKTAPTADLAPATISEFEGVRYLHLGTPWVQGAMRVSQPLTLELEYVRRMMVWLLMREPTDWSEGLAVQLGLGAGAITRFTHRVLKMQTIAVELNATVIGVGRAFFNLPHKQPGLQVLQMDAAEFVADAANVNTVDALCVDLYDHNAASPMLDSPDFYRQCHGLLVDGGVMTVNLFGRDASFAQSSAHIAQVFGQDRVFLMQATKEGNTIVAALKGQALPERQTLIARAQDLQENLDLPAKKWPRMMRPLPPKPPV